MKSTQLNVGYIIKNSKDMMVCGYDKKKGKIIIQLNVCENPQIKRLKLYKNSRNEYFNIEGKRYYLNCESGLFLKNENIEENIEKNNKRKEAIERYEKIKSRWEESKNLIRILPDVYAEICLKLKALKKGLDFNIVDKTHELKTAIAYIGGQIPSFNYNIKNDIININNKIEWDKAKEISKKY